MELHRGRLEAAMKGLWLEINTWHCDKSGPIAQFTVPLSDAALVRQLFLGEGISTMELRTQSSPLEIFVEVFLVDARKRRVAQVLRITGDLGEDYGGEPFFMDMSSQSFPVEAVPPVLFSDVQLRPEVLIEGSFWGELIEEASANVRLRFESEDEEQFTRDLTELDIWHTLERVVMPCLTWATWEGPCVTEEH
jgi:hypothetical protein